MHIAKKKADSAKPIAAIIKSVNVWISVGVFELNPKYVIANPAT